MGPSARGRRGSRWDLTITHFGRRGEDERKVSGVGRLGLRREFVKFLGEVEVEVEPEHQRLIETARARAR